MYFEINNAIEALTDVKDLKLRIDYAFLSSKTSEECKLFTNPEYFKNGVQYIIYTFMKNHDIPDEFFDNINSIQPNFLELTYNLGFNYEIDYIKILRSVVNWTNVKLPKRTYSNHWSINFTNVPILIKSNDQDHIFIKWQSFLWKVNINEANTKFWFSENTANINENRNSTFICLIDSGDIYIQNYAIVSEEDELKQLQNEFSNHLSEFNNKWEFVIPMKCLSSVYINQDQISDILINDFKQDFAKAICNAKDITCDVNMTRNIKDFDEIISLN